MKVWLGFAALAGLASCSGKSTDTGTTDTKGKPSLTIVSPTAGETFAEGDSVSFEVTAAYEDGSSADMSDVTWSSGDWGRTGASITDTGLPAGDLTVDVAATVDGHSLDDSVNITVTAPVDTGDSGTDSGTDTTDTSGGSTAYGGRFQATLTYDVYSLDCPGTIHLSIDTSNAVTGSGECYITEIDYTVDFTVDGTKTGSALAGNLIMTGSDGSEYDTPYTGTLSSGHIDGTFDQTFTSTDGSLEISGTFSADPS